MDTGLNVGTSDVATLVKVDPNELPLWRERKGQAYINQLNGHASTLEGFLSGIKVDHNCLH